ncbi:DNA polymerase III subunit epsilon-like [Stigmatopora nigra]
MMPSTTVFFDLETTGLDTNKCDIIQMAAVCGSQVFNTYCVPRSPITEEASGLTGFSVENGRLLRHGWSMPTVPLQQALESFVEFLSSFQGTTVYLAAHNARRFDAPVLNRALKEFYLTEKFARVVSNYLDTFLLSKRLFCNFPSYSLKNLVNHFLGKSYDAHNALDDAKVLQELFKLRIGNNPWWGALSSVPSR